MVGKAFLLATSLSLPGFPSETKINAPIIEERVCTIDEEMREKVRYLITECAGTERLPLEGEISGEECYITLDFNRRCKNPDFPLD